MARAVEQVFGSQTGSARKGRLVLYAQRQHSRQRPAEIARRYNRTRAAVTMAAKALDAEAKKNQELRASLVMLAEVLGGKVNS